jgi:hypothetical protein
VLPCSVCALACPVALGDGPLLAELSAMRAEVAQLRRAHDERWLDEARAESVRAVVRDVLSDSATRSSFRGDGTLVSGYDPARGFFLGIDEDGAMIKAFGFVQVRFTANAGYDAPQRTPASDVAWGSEIRRAQLFVTGQLAGPDLVWLVGMAIGSFNDPYPLRGIEVNPGAVYGTPPSFNYLNITKQFGDGWFGQVGQIYTPFTYESHLFSTAETQMGECSMIEWLFTANFTTGVELGYSDDAIQWAVCYGNEIGTVPGQWNADTNQGVALTSRLNWKLCGTWEQYALETSFPGQPFGAFLGIAGLYQNGRGINPAPVYGLNPRAATADLALMFGGANLILQGVWAQNWVEPDTTSWGGLVQGGFFLHPVIEAFGSFAAADVVDLQGMAQAGINWYIARQSLKLTGRVVVPVFGNPQGVTADVLPPQGLAGGPNPNNNVSVVLQLQAEF